MEVDNVVGLLDEFEELGYFGDSFLVEGLLHLIEIVGLCHQDTDRVNVLLTLVALVPVLVLAQQRLHHQEVLLLELQSQQTIAHLLPRQDQVRT